MNTADVQLISDIASNFFDTPKKFAMTNKSLKDLVERISMEARLRGDPGVFLRGIADSAAVHRDKAIKRARARGSMVTLPHSPEPIPLLTEDSVADILLGCPDSSW